MFCKSCGNEIGDAKFCPYCGVANGNEYVPTMPTNVMYSNKLVCPNCGNHTLQATVKTDIKTTGKNFSAGQGCLGYLIFGPLGILCGTCGQSQQQQSTNKSYFVCANCGYEFRNPEDLKADIEKKEKDVKTIGITGIALTVFLLVFALISKFAMNDEFIAIIMTAMTVFFVVIFAILYFLIKKEGQKLRDELAGIEAGLAKYGY